MSPEPSTLTTTERDFYNDARYGRADYIRAQWRNNALPDPDTRLTIHGETALASPAFGWGWPAGLFLRAVPQWGNRFFK